MKTEELKPLEVAQDYVSRCFAVVPVEYCGKKPMDKNGHLIPDWPTLSIDSSNVDQYFNGKDQNIGVVLGERSGDLVDIDLDCPEAIAIAPSFLPQTLIFGRATALESHYLYRAKGVPYHKYDNDGSIVEQRADNRMTVFPGSTHETGEVIEWSNDNAITEIDAQDLQRRVKFIAACAVLLKHWHPKGGIRDDLATAICGVLLRIGWAPDEVNQFVEIIATVAGDDELKSRLKADRLAQKLENDGSVPGIPKLKELLGNKTAGKVITWLTPDNVDEEPKKGFDLSLVMSAVDLIKLDIPPREYLVEGVLLQQSLAMIYGFRGRGKTWVVLTLAVAIASGQKFMYWDVPQAKRVLVVDGEMAASEMRQRIADLCGDTPPALLDIICSEFFFDKEQESLTINNLDHQERLSKLLNELDNEGRRPEVIIFDNLSSMTHGDENSNSEQDQLMAFMRELRHKGYTVILVHHAGKGGDQRGASRREDFLDLSIKLKDPATPASSGAKFNVEFVKVRGKMPEHNEFDAELITDEHGQLVWSMQQTNSKPSRLMQVLKYVYAYNPKMQKDIAGALGITVQAVGQQLKKARGRGLLIDMKVTEKGAGLLREQFPDLDEEEAF